MDSIRWPVIVSILLMIGSVIVSAATDNDNLALILILASVAWAVLSLLESDE